MYSCQHLKFQLLQISFSQDLPCWTALTMCLHGWVTCQHVLCLYTSAPQHKVSPLNLESWSAPSNKPKISLQNFSPEIQNCSACLVWPFIQDFQALSSPKKATDMVEEMSKNSRQGKKRYHKRDKPSSLSWESKSATYYQMQSAHMRTRVMQTHRSKLFL